MAFILLDPQKRPDDSESTGKSSEAPVANAPSGKASPFLYDRCGGVFKFLEALDLQRRAGHMLAQEREKEGKTVTAEELATLNELAAEKICPVKK